MHLKYLILLSSAQAPAKAYLRLALFQLDPAIPATPTACESLIQPFLTLVAS